MALKIGVVVNVDLSVSMWGFNAQYEGMFVIRQAFGNNEFRDRAIKALNIVLYVALLCEVELGYFQYFHIVM